uniref:Uncharacterized protein n=1 Tax=Rhipicephalus zambeziensis TaxID=60191 RepID=A0A224Y7I9_9ACAR
MAKHWLKYSPTRSSAIVLVCRRALTSFSGRWANKGAFFWCILLFGLSIIRTFRRFPPSPNKRSATVFADSFHCFMADKKIRRDAKTEF